MPSFSKLSQGAQFLPWPLGFPQKVLPWGVRFKVKSVSCLPAIARLPGSTITRCRVRSESELRSREFYINSQLEVRKIRAIQ